MFYFVSDLEGYLSTEYGPVGYVPKTLVHNRCYGIDKNGARVSRLPDLPRITLAPLEIERDKVCHKTNEFSKDGVGISHIFFLSTELSME